MIAGTDDASNDFLDSQVHCRHLIEICPDAILICHHGRVVLANDEALRLYGVDDRSQLLGVSQTELAPLDSREHLVAVLERVATERKHAPLFETSLLRCDGIIASVETLAIPIPRTDGTTAVLIVLRDITTRKQAVDERIRSENQVRVILDTAIDGIISMNELQNIILFNRAAESIFGWRYDQVIGRSIDILIPKQFAAEHRRYVEQFGRGVIQSRRMGVQRTVLALRSSGEEFPIEASISQTKIEGERIYTIILRDVTEAVRHRQQIEQQSQMLDRVTDAVSVVDSQGQITYWNHGAQVLFGWTPEEILGKNAIEVLHDGEQDFLTNIQRDMNARGSWSGELSIVSRSGKPIIVDERRTVLRDSNGAVSGYLCIDIDLTIRKKQERLSLRSQRLESIGTLAGGIAHDLNNVLTPILMGAKLLSSDRTSINRKGLLDTMVASAQRGASLIQQLLSFAGGIQGERSPVRIDQIINETRSLLEHTFPKSIVLSTTVTKECPAVLGDATELSQIVMNLCINARDAMPQGGSLVIEADSVNLNGGAAQLHPDARVGEYVLLTVSDSGTGMGPEVLDRIFDPFFTTKEIGKGTGLGLATVQGIVKSHGGFINVYSELGRGSKFSVYLPAATGTTPQNSRTPEMIADVGKGRLLLLVDDEVMILQMTGAALESAGYRVLRATNGSAAIAEVTSHHGEISAVLLDMMMPGLDGLQTLEQILKADPRSNVIACSGLRTSQREKEVLERGAKAFLPKPYSDDQLQQVLSHVLSVSAE